MKSTQSKTNYFFVDESGDPVFYDKHGNLILDTEGVSKTLILGFIKTDNPTPIRQRVLELQQEIANESYFKGVPSLQKTLISFHAKDDIPEIRERVFKGIRDLNFTAELYVARKTPNIFNSKHKRNQNKFYDDLISKLFQNKLHLAEKNEIYFATRGSKTRQKPLEDAIQHAVEAFESKWKTKIGSQINVHPQRPSGEPCLQVVDHINWAIQRAFEKGQDRYYNFIADKVSYLVDIYDKKKYPKNFYSRKNVFALHKISPL